MSRSANLTLRVAGWLLLVVLVFVFARHFASAGLNLANWLVGPAPAEEPPAVVLRRLELRLDEPLDKTHPVAGGERYRLFECREVRR